MDEIKGTALVRLLGLAKIPMIFYCRPSVMNINDEEMTLKIPLTRRTKNHVGSFYFGAFAVGADLTGGLLAMRFIQKQKQKIVPIFKDFKADFLKLAKGDVHFTCRQGAEIKALVEEAARTGERQNIPLKITASVPSIEIDPVAEMVITLSIKVKE
ncbi:MAG: DUF4442 domain-containing protein [Candidatus Marinimicrobia bacterium]|jgi:acyl-coenzyme A thioesterase PaaI-like protein|nr:DUF4442 domain-containing protein [Candidatus Neomarinimicrobiota bacterium]MDP6790099.1 DUF4442 domain-containing protein [Candidatus Neomarinimicrobiota bacterium]MDP7072362.1 DUF4442 domain-containing protein [Candidatus Neomarinimicrobiota bacterium]